MPKQKDIIQSKRGIENFIIKKLEKAYTISKIRVILERAGFSKSEIEKGFQDVRLNHKTLHQDIAASNNFFPILKKIDKKLIKGVEKIERELNFESIKHIGLFAGRIRRKDFIVAILFLFSLFFSILIIVSSFISAFYPESWKLIGYMISSDSNGMLLLYLPILFAPFILFFLSMVVRRLHDLDLPGILSFLYLGVFVFPFSEYVSRGMIVFDLALFILFIFLMSKRGEPVTNRYGKSPASHGSTFIKILNLK